MTDKDKEVSADELIVSLRERAKELECIYQVEEALGAPDLPLEQRLQVVACAIVRGWQFPEVCRASVTLFDAEYRCAPFEPSPWRLQAVVKNQDEVVGSVNVYYLEKKPDADEGPFLREEVKLINTIAERIGHFILYQRMKEMHEEVRRARKERADSPAPTAQWRIPLHLLRDSDAALYLRFARRMLNNLASMGVAEAQTMLQEADATCDIDEEWTFREPNIPGRRRIPDNALLLTDRPFELAADHLSDQEILARLQEWMQEDKAAAFLKIIDNPRSTLHDVADAIRRYHHLVKEDTSLSKSKRASVSVTLIRRFLNENLDYIKIAKEFVGIDDFRSLLERTILPVDSNGKLGGKGSGLLLADNVLKKRATPDRPVGQVKIPRTWYVASDGLLDFIGYNDLEDVVEQKYKEIDQIRQEYPNVIQLFKNSAFPPALAQGLSMALDDLGDMPLIVRSSSLLEDRLGTAFSGKYKSLFLANQGSKQDRFAALIDAIAEIYASVFGPDPIEYRRDRGLLDFNEEMGILIQEVVGKRIGRYFLPALGGVAFSRNEFRWSPRIKREDGLIRMVPGLGTRAVDRVPDDYPILVVPGQPDLRVNVAIDEIVRYAPRKVDAINLEKNTLETLEIRDLIRTCGTDYPAFERVFSRLEHGMLKKPVTLLTDPEKDELVVTFGAFFAGEPLLAHLGNILKILEETLGSPVDIEFAHDGLDFYLLQCRPQSHGGEDTAAPIPKDVSRENIVFSAERYVSNGWVPDVTHIVYVDPEAYGRLGDRAELVAVGRAVGRLNKLLPKRQFILMGPGRWGSRGDIKLGVNVTYADISNTAMLIEIARKKGSYLPDLSFGTHFFQDLVESRIRYLPLYPDDEGIVFNEPFLLRSRNLLAELLPEYSRLDDTIRVIDVRAESDGRVLRVLLNADLDEALGLLTEPDGQAERTTGAGSDAPRSREEFWRWRLQMAERIAAEMDPDRFGVAALYVFGSTKNASAGPGSDIDMLVHFRGTERQRRDLLTWLEGWSLSLAEMNYWRSGYRSDGLLDVHLVTDQDIENRTSYACKIGAVTDAARPLRLGKRPFEELP